MNNKIKIGLFVLIIIGIITLCLIYNKKDVVTKTKSQKHSNLAIMIKEDGATDYVQSNSKNIPKGNYALNYEKSYCKNNGKIGNYDSVLGKVSFSFIGTDSCYLYFDYYQVPIINNVSFNVRETTISLNVTSTNGNNNISSYYYSNDNGTTFNKSSSSTYNFTNLTACNLYNFVIYAEDTKGYKSQLYKASKAPSAIKMLANKKILCDNKGSIKSTQDDIGTSYYYIDEYGRSNSWLKFGKYTDDYIKYRGEISYVINDYDTMEECTADNASNCREIKYASKGDDIYWRIIRINGDNSIRILYNGTVAPTGKEYENSELTSIGINFFPNKDLYKNWYNKYGSEVFYKVLFLNYQFDQNYSVHGNKHNSSVVYDSNAKTYLENWFSKYMINYYNEGIITDQIFCNDRTLYSQGTEFISTLNNMDLSVSYNYGFYQRYYSGNLSLVCPNFDDKFTVNYNSSWGNGSLTYPVGLLTGDEAVLTGKGSFLFLPAADSDINYFSMTPFNEINLDYYFTYGMSNNKLSLGVVDNSPAGYFKPVINLSSNLYFSGSGSWDDPYEVVN